MSTYEARVRDFHIATEVDTDADFSIPLLCLRKRLLAEEVEELNAEIDSCIKTLETGGRIAPAEKAKLLKEMADMQYVLSGMAVTFGLPMAEAFARVHESNLSKLGPDGKPIRREDGKVLKGPNYRPANLDDIVG